MAIVLRSIPMFERLIAFILLFTLSPAILILFILVKATSRGSFLFTQKRAGKDLHPFLIYKIRTMVDNAEALKKNYLSLNQADGPTFKIFDDPRYTRIGKLLSKTGLDEIPQLINIVKGEMTFIGPRPLPVDEARRIPKRYHVRFSVLPGITSPWVVRGSHNLSFHQWMELDTDYIKHRTLLSNTFITIKTISLIVMNGIRQLREYLSSIE